MGIEDSIMDDIEGKLVWYGHVQRMDETRLPKQDGMDTFGKTKERETKNNGR